MTELQQARAMYLDALTEQVRLAGEVERLKQKNFELQSQLISSEARRLLAEIVTRSFFTVL